MAIPLLFAAVLLVPGSVVAATIHGQVFTAEHEDSIAAAVALTLVHRGPDGQLQHVNGTTDASGHYHFIDVVPDSAISYVLSIDFRGRSFLGSPIRFEPGQDEVVYNVLLTDRPAAAGTGMGMGAGAGGGIMPGDHPSVPGLPMQGRPVAQPPLHAILIVLWIVLAFAGLAMLAARKPSPSAQESTPAVLPAQARTLVRDIASLDERRAEGVLGEEEYQKVRSGLVARLRSVAAGQRSGSRAAP